MEIIKKQLTDKGVRLVISDSKYTVNKVLVDNANNFKNVNAIADIKHSFVCDFDQYNDVIVVYVPSDASTLIFITVCAELNDMDYKDTVMFVNEFSIFKAKTSYLDVYCDCSHGCCHDHHCHDCYCHGRCEHDACLVHHHPFECDHGSCSNWSLGHCGENCCNDYGTYCRSCEDKNKHYSMLSFMLRWNLFEQCYRKNNVCGTMQFYKDLCRTKNLNKIPFECVDLDFDFDTNPDRVHDLYDKMNTWIKNNVHTCPNNIIDKILMIDMYSLLFSKCNNNGSPEWILQDHVWNMKDEYWFNDKTWNG